MSTYKLMEVSKVTGISRQTLLNRIQKGEIKAELNDVGVYSITEKELKRIHKEHIQSQQCMPITRAAEELGVSYKALAAQVSNGNVKSIDGGKRRVYIPLSEVKRLKDIIAKSRKTVQLNNILKNWEEN